MQDGSDDLYDPRNEGQQNSVLLPPMGRVVFRQESHHGSRAYAEVGGCAEEGVEEASADGSVQPVLRS